HCSRISVPDRRRAANEFPFAAVNTADACLSVRGARLDPARLPARYRRALSLLQLRRLYADCVNPQISQMTQKQKTQEPMPSWGGLGGDRSLGLRGVGRPSGF